MDSLNGIRSWFDFLAQVRRFFVVRDFCEVQTPYLVTNPGMEPELEPFVTEWRPQAQSRQGVTYYLPTSPELHMKRLLAAGLTEIFEIKSVFRNEEITDIHRPEFTMLEWYRANSDLEKIEHDLVELVVFLSDKKVGGEKTNGKSWHVKKFTVADMFFEFTGFHLTPQTTKNELLVLAESKMLKPDPNWDFNDIFHFIWVSQVEPHLPLEPFLLSKYPPSQAALAKIDSQGWAARTEFYWRGVEIANGFDELTDGREQRRRFELDMKKRIEYGRTPLEIDEKFMAALDKGMPASGGMALGLERLFMVINGYKNLDELPGF